MFRMRNGMSLPFSSLRPRPEVALRQLRYGLWSTPSSISAEVGPHGACCRRIFLLIRRCIATSGRGARTVLGRGSMMPCAVKFVRRRGARSVPVQPWSIARASRRRKRGPQRVRCGQESPRTQAAYRRRHVGFDPGLRSSLCRRTRPGWSKVDFGELGCSLSSPAKDLGGRRLRWEVGGLGKYAWVLGFGDCKEIRRCGGVRTFASSLDRREDLCVAWPVSSIE